MWLGILLLLVLFFAIVIWISAIKSARRLLALDEELLKTIELSPVDMRYGVLGDLWEAKAQYTNINEQFKVDGLSLHERQRRISPIVRRSMWSTMGSPWKTIKKELPISRALNDMLLSKLEMYNAADKPAITTLAKRVEKDYRDILAGKKCTYTGQCSHYGDNVAVISTIDNKNTRQHAVWCRRCLCTKGWTQHIATVPFP